MMAIVDYVLKTFTGFGKGVIAECVHLEDIEGEYNVGY
jgi:hypothetical protein